MYYFKKKVPIVENGTSLFKSKTTSIYAEDNALIIMSADNDYFFRYSYVEQIWFKVCKYTSNKIPLTDAAPFLLKSEDDVILSATFFDICKPNEKLEYTEQEKWSEYKNHLRHRRERECYSIVNRGRLWYDMLTIEQITDLGVWYETWLDVTDTFVVPDIPNWLNDKLEKMEDIL